MSRPKTEAATFKKLMLRLPVHVLEACKAKAEKEHRSVNAQILHELEIQLRETARHEVPALVHGGTQ